LAEIFGQKEGRAAQASLTSREKSATVKWLIGKVADSHPARLIAKWYLSK